MVFDSLPGTTSGGEGPNERKCFAGKISSWLPLIVVLKRKRCVEKHRIMQIRPRFKVAAPNRAEVEDEEGRPLGEYLPVRDALAMVGCAGNAESGSRKSKAVGSI